MYINHANVMTLTQFIARSTWIAYAFEWKKLLKCHLKGKTSRKLAIGQNIDYSVKKMAQGLHLPLHSVKNHNIQTCLLVYAADHRGAFTGPLVIWFHSGNHMFSLKILLVLRWSVTESFSECS